MAIIHIFGSLKFIIFDIAVYLFKNLSQIHSFVLKHKYLFFETITIAYLIA